MATRKTSRRPASTVSPAPEAAASAPAVSSPVPSSAPSGQQHGLTYRLRVARSEAATAPSLASAQVKVSGHSHRVVLGASAGAPGGLSRGAAAREEFQVPADDVVKVEYEGGLVMWTRADDLMHERGQRPGSSVNRGQGTGDADVWELDARMQPQVLRDTGEQVPEGERGLLSVGIKALEFFGIDVMQGAARTLAGVLEEKRLGREPGLYRVNLDSGQLGKQVTEAEEIPSDVPVLVFLHGTMSSFQGSFADMFGTGPAAKAVREQLAKAHGEHVYALEHRSLTESPIANALMLMSLLPKGARLHLVSHSRGGLVGELLCLAERDRQDDPLRADMLDALFAADATMAEQLGLAPLLGDALKQRNEAYASERKELAQLIKKLDDSKPRIERFVRVACPARGTTLASGRLDRWLSVLDYLVPQGLFSEAKDFLLAVVKERTDPRTLPGLEAMMPGSALTRLLQHPALVTRSDLTVIAGDCKGDGLLGRLKLLALDWFYSSDHDLVVNTGSMYGGLRRVAGAARFAFDQGAEVSHFAYFKNPRSLDWVMQGLRRTVAQPAGFQPLAPEQKSTMPRWRSALKASRAGSAPRPLAVLIPGTMGSQLKAQGSEVWLNYLALLRGHMGRINIDASEVVPDGVIDDFYGPLIEHLAQTHRVEVFAYDWRFSVREAAERLAERLQEWLPQQERERQAVHLVGHSMGGLVSRAMIADGAGGSQVWGRIKALPGSRLLMLGTPNRGSHEAVRWLVGMNPTQIKLCLLDFTRDANGVIDIVSRFPGLTELLPFDEEPNPWASTSTWRQLKAALGAGWRTVDDAVLREASRTWALLRQAAPEKDHMIYVAGCQSATVVGHDLVPVYPGRPRMKLAWRASAEGDGTVTWASGRLADVPMYYAPDTAHDELCANTADSRIFRGYVDLLLNGRTDQLSSTPPRAAARSGTAGAAAAPGSTFMLPDLPGLDALPTEDDLRGAGFGPARLRRRAKDAHPVTSVLQISVRHGDLGYARFPVMVGHYVGDTIVSAELALDRRLAGDDVTGPLSQQRDLGLYPGPLGTHAVFFNTLPGRRPEGALVIGLGQVGELSPGRLEASVRDVLLNYALRQRQRSNEPSGQRLSLSVSALLVGTGEGGLLVRDSLESIVRGALAANRKLVEARLDGQVLLAELEFIELFEDVALTATSALADLVSSTDLAGKVTWTKRELEQGEGRRSRNRFEADVSWWQRIEITEDRKADRLRFVVSTDRARAEETLASGQLALADRFISQACGSAQTSADVSKTLFEMLLPQRLKESAPDQRDRVLLLDEAAARFPWELMEDRWSRLGRPAAVVSGLVRQFKTAEFRAQPAQASENSVFVVGNPKLEGWRGFADLDGARQEANAVWRQFEQNGFNGQAVVDQGASAILSALHSRAWRVLHLAGHGEHGFALDPQAPASSLAPAAASLPVELPVELPDGRMAQPLPSNRQVSGMVIGPNTFLTPGDVEQMRHVPEVVFINCCHLGNTGGGSAKHNLLAANLGVQFIRMGVRAVVCAGWAVHDGAALTFAEQFYRQLLGGATFGQAVKAARLTTWEQHPGINTWGAYQCYGDPSYRLVRGEPSTESRAPRRSFVSHTELVIELNNLVAQTRMEAKDKGSSPDALHERALQRIDALLARVPSMPDMPASATAAPQAPGTDNMPRHPWLHRADVCAALGFAYGEARLFDQAVLWLDRALSAEEGDCPVRAAEQWANFSIRLAAERWLQVRADATLTEQAQEGQRTELAARIEEALAQLDAINSRAPTQERFALLGSACKRLAWVQSGTPRTEALLNMAQYYRQALDRATLDTACYPFANWAVACLLLDRIDPQGASAPHRPAAWQAIGHDEVEAMRHSTQAQLAKAPKFWLASGLADLRTVQLLMTAPDPQQPEVLAKLVQQASEHYNEAMARGASLRERASLHEHLDFLLDLAEDTHHRWSDEHLAALKSIRSSL